MNNTEFVIEHYRERLPTRFQKVKIARTFPTLTKNEKNVTGIFLTGKAGSGKSYTAAQYFLKWVSDFCQENPETMRTSLLYNSVYISVYDILKKIKHEYSHGTGYTPYLTEKEFYESEIRQNDMSYRHYLEAARLPRPGIIDECRGAALLVIDDLGSENSTSWSDENICAIINYRYDEMVPTIITSNLCLTEIQKISGRMASRISSYYSISVTKEDKRKAI